MRLGLLFILLSFLFSCNEDDGVDVVNINNNGANVIVLNEGNFQSTNGSISVYNTITKVVKQKVFQANNQGRPLGDVVQSIVKIDDRYFIVVNNSKKIEVVSVSNLKSVGKIEGFKSPRYILPISDIKAYVSDLYEEELYVIDPSSLTVKKTIETKGWTEQMLLADDKAFVCQVDSAQIYVFDTENDSLLAKINTNLQPQSIERDKNGMIWVSCSGGINEGFPALHQIDPITFKIIKTLELPDASKSIGEIEMNVEGNKIMYLQQDLFEFSISSNTLPQIPKISANNRLFYGFGVHPKTGEIYLSDAIDYLQKGVVYRSDSNGIELSNFKVGLIPGDFYFEE